MSKLTKIFVTKYALTVGPQVVMAEVKYEGDSAFWWVGGYHHSAHGKDFWLTDDIELFIGTNSRKLRRAVKGWAFAESFIIMKEEGRLLR